MIDAVSTRELDIIQYKIDIARAWAEKHFNTANCHNTELITEDLMLVKPSYFVEYPTPDTMRVAPSLMGKPMDIWITYRLHFKRDGRLVWQGTNPITGHPLPGLVVERI